MKSPLLINHVQIRLIALALAALFQLYAGGAASLAQDGAAMPRRITERLWQDPGPVQDQPGAPRLLIVYPREGTKLSNSEELTRYAGRVDPPDAPVYLDGQEIRKFPGGTFTGQLKAPVGSRTVRFSSSLGGKSTTVSRTLTRAAPIPPPRHRPMEFHKEGWLRPWGEYWLREGSELKLKVLASPGNAVFYRIGDTGQWRPMPEVSAGPKEGGAYAATLNIDRSVPEQLVPLTFQLRPLGSGSGGIQPITRNWGINLKRLPPEVRLSGTVDHYLTTFLKNPHGWDRWGNWPQGVPFPIVERWNDRFSVDFGGGETGWIEVENTRLMEAGEFPVRPQLRLEGARALAAGAATTPDRLDLIFQGERPPGHVFHAGSGFGPDSLTISLPGSAGLAGWEPPAAGPISLALEPGSANNPPRLKADLGGRPLWGYGLDQTAPDKVRLMVRAKPELPAASARPLQGLKIMVDAGHGGSDLGALGPSGLTEADVNLVVAAYLGEKLEAQGAQVRQLRTGDYRVELDDRILRALEWEPDLFISIHHDDPGFGTHPVDSSGPKAFYHYPFQRPLAESISAEITALMAPRESPLAKENVLRVNRNLSICPSVLVEGAFITNPYDEYKLRRSDTLEAIAGAISRGILAAVADTE